MVAPRNKYPCARMRENCCTIREMYVPEGAHRDPKLGSGAVPAHSVGMQLQLGAQAMSVN